MRGGCLGERTPSSTAPEACWCRTCSGRAAMSGSRSSSSEESSEEEGPAVEVSQELLLDELSADTLAALQAHLQRKQESSDSDEEEDGGAGVSENFGLSQFWVPKHSVSQYAALLHCVAHERSLLAVRRRHSATASRGGDRARQGRHDRHPQRPLRLQGASRDRACSSDHSNLWRHLHSAAVLGMLRRSQTARVRTFSSTIPVSPTLARRSSSTTSISQRWSRSTSKGRATSLWRIRHT